MDSSSIDDWTIVSVKKSNKKKSIKNIISLDEIKIIVISVLTQYNAKYIYIYGSRARGTNRIDSDVDIMCFMSYPLPSSEQLFDIKTELIQSLKLNVDFICMQLTNKYVDISDERTKCYYENVLEDAIRIYPSDIQITLHELIDKSIKHKKI
jgi:hypothetical protein